MKRKKIEQYGTILIFCIVIYGFLFMHILSPDKKISVSERRKYAQFPQISQSAILDGSFSSNFESYLLDQFPMRDTLRMAKSVLRFFVFRQMDNHDIYIAENSAIKIEDTLDEKQVLLAVDKMKYCFRKYLKNCQVYYAVIPDKAYYASEEKGYPHYSYARLQEIMQAELSEKFTYINLFDTLDLSDYYRTDSHWKQECLQPVRDKIAESMLSEKYDNWSDLLPDWSEYKVGSIKNFYGVYYGQSALPMGSDTIHYLMSSGTNEAIVSSAEKPGDLAVYQDDNNSLDKYDVFLHGAQALLTITNPNASTDKELIIFRDSYGSSLAPLFIDTYEKITLIDLRYVTSEYLGKIYEFHERSDVLFLYSTTVLNTGSILR